MDRDELLPCLFCGELCDGDVCDEVCARQLDFWAGVPYDDCPDCGELRCQACRDKDDNEHP